MQKIPKDKYLIAFILIGLAILGYFIWPEVNSFLPIKTETEVATAEQFILHESDPQPQERVTILPNDGKKWYSVFIVHDKKFTNPKDKALDNLFTLDDYDGRLKQLKEQTTVKVYDQKDYLYKTRYKNMMGGILPQYWLIRTEPGSDEGQVCYKVSGNNIPQSSSVMASEISQSIERCWPRPKPNPQPVPPSPSPSPIPDLRPDNPEVPNDEISVLMLIVLSIAAGLGGAWTENRRN